MDVLKKYFKKQAKTLDSDFKASDVDNQTGDTGENREVILKEWLEGHLPSSVSPRRGGKILDVNGKISKQVDIVNYVNSVAQFGVYPKSYFYAEGVSSAIQVKSTLGSSDLKEAFDNLNSVKECDREPGYGLRFTHLEPKIPTHIFAFSTRYKSAENIKKAMERLLKQDYSPVDFVCVNRKCFIVYNRGTWTTKDRKGNNKKLPEGYLVVDKSPECIWRMVIELSNEATQSSSAKIDLQKYFYKHLK